MVILDGSNLLCRKVEIALLVVTLNELAGDFIPQPKIKIQGGSDLEIVLRVERPLPAGVMRPAISEER